jgi:PAS domain S-box-containing protein
VAGNTPKRRRIVIGAHRKSKPGGNKQAEARAVPSPISTQKSTDRRQVEERELSSQRLLLAITRVQALFIDEAKPAEVFGLLLQELLTLTDSAYGFIGEVDRTPEGQPFLRTHAITDIAWNEATKAMMAEQAPTLVFRNLKTLFGHVMTSGNPVIANDPAHDPRAGGLPPGHPPMHAFLGLPFYRGELMTGMVGIANRPGGYDETLVTYLEPFLATCAQLLEGYRHRTLRGEAEVALRESEERWHLAVQGSHDGIWDWNIATSTVFFSSRWKAIRGFEEQEMTGSLAEWRDGIHPEDRDRVLHQIDVYLTKRSPEFSEEYRVRCKDGSYRWVLDRGVALWNADGVVVRMAGSESDITERKESEQALLEAHTAVELAMEGISKLDEAGHYLFVNAQYAALLGYRPEELIGQSWEITVHPDDRTFVLDMFARMLAIGKAEAEVRGVKKDGSLIHKHVVIVKPNGPAVTMPGHFCFARDITQRKQVEEHLRRTRFAMDQAVDAVYWIDPQARILYTNEAASAMLGYAPDEFLRMTVHDLNPNFHPERWPGWWTETRAKKVVSLETTHLAKDGRQIPVDIHVSFLAYGGQEFHCAFVRDISERKRAEAALRHVHEELEQRVVERTSALRRSEQRYAGLVNSADGIIMEVDDAYRITFVSQQAERILGYPVAQWLDDPMFWINHLHPDDLMWAPTYCQDMTKQGLNHEFEYRMFASDGRIVWIRDSVSVMRDDEGRIKLSCILLDVTKYKDMVDRLRLTQYAVDHASDQIFVIGSDGSFRDVNESACRRLGYTKEELLRMSVIDIDPDFPAGVWDSFWAEFTKVKRIQLETRHRSKSGEIYPVEVVANYLNHEGQELDYAIVRDISERKRNEAALLESEERFSTAFNESAIGMAIVSPDGRWLQVNQALCEIVGYSKAELEASTFQTITHPDDLEADLRQLRQMLSGALRAYQMEKRYIHKNGSIVWAVLNVSLVRHVDGTPQHVIAQIQDITERKELQEQRMRYTDTLEQQVAERSAQIAKLESQRAQAERLAALGRLAAGVAHEINNPIAGIKNAFTLVKQAVDPAHPQYEFVGLIDREIARVSSIVQNMYQLYGRESGKVETVDLQAMIGDIKALFAKQLQQRQLRLVVEVEPGIDRLDVSRSDFLQIVLNLLNNAVDCSREGTTITLSAREEAEVVRIALADQGSGISPEVLPQIFDPFFTTKTEGGQKGMGLGLSISQSLATAMGGRIDVETRIGQGSTFSILLPRHRVAAVPPDQTHTIKEGMTHGC